MTFCFFSSYVALHKCFGLYEFFLKIIFAFIQQSFWIAGIFDFSFSVRWLKSISERSLHFFIMAADVILDLMIGDL